MQISGANQLSSRARLTEQLPTVLEQILEQGEKQPLSLAISQGCFRLNFRDLLARAEALAAQLAPHVTAERKPVAVATSDAAEMITAALAAWLQGCPYLPLDPAGPRQRMQHMLAESGTGILVTGSRERREFPQGAWAEINWQTASPSGPESQLPRFPEATARPEAAARPEDPAYIIYTSGSTGLPKGVIVSHANLSNFVAWYRSSAQISAPDRTTQFASLTFDASVFEIWAHLTAGASVWLVGLGMAMAEKELQEFILHNSITHCFAPTAMAEEMLGLSWPAGTTLRYLLTGADTLRRFPPQGLPFRLVNNYGPTECTVLATSGVIEPESKGYELPSIGKPIPGAEIYLLDAELAPVKPGAIGEIYIAGRAVAMGYAGRPDLTRERFLDNPFEAGTRMYRTGDRGRWREDGEIEFCGRVDVQLKVRGYRIEPDEIVQKLRGHSAVHACAVKAIGSGANAQVAVYVELESLVTADDLRTYLAEHLPSYMIPDYFVQVKRLPLSDRGKVDMENLPMPSEDNLLPHGASADEEGRNEIESELAAIICQLLKRTSVNSTDNFFRLGGHSLLAAQVIARVRRAFGVELPLRTVFESSTVRALAAQIEQRIVASMIAAESAALSELRQEG